jgi:beta-lactamase class A
MSRPVPHGAPGALLAALLLGFASGPLAGQDEHRAILKDKFQAQLEAVAADFDGVLGVQAVDLVAAERFGVNVDLVFPQGSAVKIPILLELFRRAEGEPDLLGRRLEVTRVAQVEGSGILRYLTDGGTAASLEDLAVLMILESDNTATNLLIDELGMESVNALVGSLGTSQTQLRRKMIRPDASARGEENLSTPAEAALLMERIALCELPLSEAACFRVQEILELPKGGAFRDAVPSEVPVAWKSGGIEGVAAAWGLVSLPDRPYVLTVMTNYGTEGSAAVRAASRVAWDYFYRLARSTDYGARVPLDVLRRNRGGGGASEGGGS